MSLLSDPLTFAVLALAVILLGLAKGGLAGVGALATPIVALVLPPTLAAALLLPILIVQDVVSVWSFRKTWDGWIIGWMLPGAAIGIAAGYVLAEQVDEPKLMAALGAITLVFGLYRLWVERGGRVVAASTSPGWVGSLFGVATGFTSQIAHAGGPPFQMWVTPRRLPHLVFVGTSSILFAASRLIQDQHMDIAFDRPVRRAIDPVNDRGDAESSHFHCMSRCRYRAGASGARGAA